jgi:hypothetical protein
MGSGGSSRQAYGFGCGRVQKVPGEFREGMGEGDGPTWTWRWQAAIFRRTAFGQASRIGAVRVFPAMEGALRWRIRGGGLRLIRGRISISYEQVQTTGLKRRFGGGKSGFD